jgi:hypothetical protein
MTWMEIEMRNGSNAVGRQVVVPVQDIPSDIAFLLQSSKRR